MMYTRLKHFVPEIWGKHVRHPRERSLVSPCSRRHRVKLLSEFFHETIVSCSLDSLADYQRRGGAGHAEPALLRALPARYGRQDRESHVPRDRGPCHESEEGPGGSKGELPGRVGNAGPGCGGLGNQLGGRKESGGGRGRIVLSTA
eukprot:375509-Rhodomonas_salina.1